MSENPIEEQLRETDDDRLRFILEGQLHCDHYLTPLADPRGKSVLVVGAGAGTEMLWCLRNGAREVVGIDVLGQRPAALERAVRQLGIQPAPAFSILQMGIEKAQTLGRRFDLILSNNVFEHLSDLRRALEVCASLVEPGTGRIAIFTAPLYYSSSGSHLPAEPWEHLWQAPETLRRRLLNVVPPRHALNVLDLPVYLFEEISLNRMRLPDLLEAIRSNDLVVLNLRALRDRHLRDLPAYLPRLERARQRENLAITDLAVEGLSLELMKLDGSALGEAPVSVEEALLARQRGELEEQNSILARRNAELESALAQAQGDNARLRDESLYFQRTATEVKRVLDAVEASWSFRLGRLVTAPARWIRSRRRAG
ncbi:MAG TPA: methyltransferase domain-containing protein [Thermoanaerobaculia bacterium]